jgi:hypothetical protein
VLIQTSNATALHIGGKLGSTDRLDVKDMAAKAGMEFTMDGLDFIFASPELMFFMIVIADMAVDDDDDDDEDEDPLDVEVVGVFGEINTPKTYGPAAVNGFEPCKSIK